MSTVIEFKPGCLLTAARAKVPYKVVRNKKRLTFGNVTVIGETIDTCLWMAHWYDLAPKPERSYFGRGGDAA